MNLVGANHQPITLYAQWVEEIYVASVNGTLYTTLQNAINAVPANNTQTTVTLLTNVSESLTVNTGQNILFNFQNYEVNNVGQNAVIENYGTVEITNGTLTMNIRNKGAINNNKNAVLKISGGTVRNIASEAKHAVYNKGGRLEISGNAYLTSVSGRTNSNIRATVENLADEDTPGTLIITGGTIVSQYYCAVENKSIMIIGEEGGGVSRSSPLIQGKISGVIASSNFDFFDGVIKGETAAAINNESYVDNVEDHYILTHSQETVGNETYNVVYLGSGIVVTFDGNGGTPSESERGVDYGDQIGALPTATYGSKRFDGWFTDPSGGTQITSSTVITSSITYYAHWTDRNTVTFNGNGGTPSEAERYILSGEEIGELPTATYGNKRFDGWFTDPSGGTQITSSTIINSTVTYYAHWTDRVTVTFDGNGGTPSESEKYILPGDQIGALPTATYGNKRFDGWFTDPSGGTQITPSTTINSTVTFYAHWTRMEAEVTFNANGGTLDGINEEDTIIVNIGSSIGSANLPTPTRQYKTFAGWYTDPNPNSGTLIDGTEQITQDVTYYAHWTPLMVTVNFDPTSGTIPQADASKSVEAGGPVGELPTSATSANQYFTGWYTDPTNGTRIDENEMIGDTTVTFYAHWISTAVARIGPIHYATLQDAIDDVPENTQTTITLITNDLEAVSITASKNIILDLDGHTLYNNGSKKAHAMDNNDLRPSVIENLGTLKIMNGTITNNSSQAAVNTGTGNVIIEDATITHTGTSGKNTKQAVYVYSGTVLIKGNSTISANNSGAYNGNNRGALQIAGGTVTITGGSITSSAGPAIVNQTNGTVILGEEDGTAGNTTPVIQAKTYGIETSGTFNFYDGIVKGITGSINGSVADYEDGASRVDSTEVIGTNTYHTTCYQ